MIFDRKDKTIKLSKNFNSNEFMCKCGICTTQIIDINLVNKLQKLREMMGEPIYINSGYRCEKHNTNIGGVKKSQHTLGKACDIRTNTNKELCCLHRIANYIDFNGLGIYDTFVHIDVRNGTKARWDYRTK